MQQALAPSSVACKQPQTNPVQGSRPQLALHSARAAARHHSRRAHSRISAATRAHSPSRPTVERLSVPDAAPAGSPHPDALRRRKEAEARKQSRQQYTEASASGKGWWEIMNPTNMHVVASAEEFKERVRLAKGENTLVVVDYFAPWCHACKSLHPQIQKLASEHCQVTFLSVNASIDSLKTMCDEIGVPKLPYFHFLKGQAGVVAEFSASLTADRLQHLRSQVHIHSAKC